MAVFFVYLSDIKGLKVTQKLHLMISFAELYRYYVAGHN